MFSPRGVREAMFRTKAGLKAYSHFISVDGRTFRTHHQRENHTAKMAQMPPQLEMSFIPDPPEVIDEGICRLQNYRLPSGEDKALELAIDPPVVFYDYAFDQDWNIGRNDEVPDHDEQGAYEILEKKDMWAQLPLSGYTAEGQLQLNYEVFPKRLYFEVPQFLRVMCVPHPRFH